MNVFFKKHVQYITTKVCPEPVYYNQGLAAKGPAEYNQLNRSFAARCFFSYILVYHDISLLSFRDKK